MAEVGPDGNVWVIDWYNFIVQHNPTPAGFRTGKGNAYETALRDKTHGRIYRIVPKDGDAEDDRPRSTGRRPEALVAALKNDNLFWRLHAQRLLVERGKRDVVPDLIKLARGPHRRRDRPERRRDPRPVDAARPGRRRLDAEAAAGRRRR